MSTNGQLPVEERREILVQMMQEWRQQSFAATVNAKVAERLKDERMREQAVGQLKRAEVALLVLKEEIALVVAELAELGVSTDWEVVGVGSE